MNTIIQYFKDNPKLFYVSVICLCVCLILAIVIIICKKAVKNKRNAEKLCQVNVETNECVKDDEEIESQTPSETIDTKEEIIEDNVCKEEPIKEEAVTEVLDTKELNSDAQKEETPPKKALDSTVNKQKQDKTDTRYAGKWVIIEENKRYSAELRASNAEILLRTESYSALSGIKSGIETVKNNVEKNNFAISMDKNGNFFFKLYSSSTRLLCVSEGYTTKSACERAIESVKRFSKTAIIVREEKKDE